LELAARSGQGVRRENVKAALVWVGGGLLVGILVTLLDPVGRPTQGLPAYLLLGGIAGLVAWGARRALGAEPLPRALNAAVGLAFVLRIGVGIALAHALPRYGYDREAQNAGYVYQDAWLRDKDAWDLGRSERPLVQAFTAPQSSDQYGGLLWLSAGIYRFLSGGVQQPLMIVLLSATAGAIAVWFGWGFASMVFGGKPGMAAAWILSLYPDAVLPGASQMREPFIIAGLALALFGFARMRTGAIRPGLAQVLSGSLIALVISPPSALMILLLIGLGWAWEGRLRPSWGLGWPIALGGVALVLTLAAWSAVTGVGGGNPLALLANWLTEGADYQLYLLERGSGWAQKLFELTPAWAHAPMATIYGLTRPLLPASLADNSGATLWQLIGVWRGLGWFVLLPFLIYAALAAVRSGGWRRLEVYLAVGFWLAAILVSYKAAGDDWDNPRYRATMIPLMAALAGWGWWHARQSKSMWLRRSLTAYLGANLLLGHWFIGRYYHTPRLSLEATLASMAGFLVVYLTVAVLRDRRPESPNLTVSTPEV
jgi:hypothetical protein